MEKELKPTYELLINEKNKIMKDLDKSENIVKKTELLNYLIAIDDKIEKYMKAKKTIIFQISK